MTSYALAGTRGSRFASLSVVGHDGDRGIYQRAVLRYLEPEPFASSYLQVQDFDVAISAGIERAGDWHTRTHRFTSILRRHICSATARPGLSARLALSVHLSNIGFAVALTGEHIKLRHDKTKSRLLYSPGPYLRIHPPTTPNYDWASRRQGKRVAAWMIMLMCRASLSGSCR